MYKKLPYDPKDLTPVGFMARFPLILAVNPAAGFTSAKQLLDEVRKNPAKYSYASPGVGSPHHLAMELLKERTQSFIVHVPYRGTALAIQDVMSGQVPMMVLDTAAGLPQIRSGKVKALAVMSKKRIPSLPDVPTLDEVGVPGVYASSWYGLMAPAGTPKEIIDKVQRDSAKIILADEFRARLAQIGMEPVGNTPSDFAAAIRSQSARWAKVIQERNIKVD
jgi:tripartite-type tricarboxylate transporter receptor subunit TctC